MERDLTPVQWAEHLGQTIKHNKLGICVLVGLRTQCEENNNLMLNVYTLKGQFFWIYDYETGIL